VIRFVFFVALLAAAIYLFVRLMDRRSGGKAAWGPATRKQQEHGRRTIAPDDDEQFLRDLDKKRKEPKEPDPED
jgi:hypothetical protein